MIIRALVVDDEPLGRRAVRRFLGKHVGVDVIGECGDGESAVRAIRERKPDLVFLDVQMPEMDGFQVLSEVGANEMHRIISSLERLAATRIYPGRLPIPRGGRVLFVATKDIDWIEAEGNYVRLHVGNRDYEFRETLAALEEKLNPSEFLRIHRSTIVNIHRIKEIQAWFHGHHRVLLENGTELRMSRYQREIARKLGLS